MTMLAPALNQLPNLAPIDDPPYSPMWWLRTLERELARRNLLVQVYEDYFEGRFKLAFATPKFEQTFGDMLAAVSDPYMSLVVSSTTERMDVQGFHIGAIEDTNEAGDRVAMDIWQRSHLDDESPLLFTESAKHGEAYLLAWWDPVEDRETITCEHPSNMIVRRDPATRQITVALKCWQEEDGSWRAFLILPTRVYHFRRGPGHAQDWQEQLVELNPLGFVPVHPIVNDRQMKPCLPPHALLAVPHLIPPVSIGLGRSDLADVISTQDQINKLLCDMFVAAEFAAFRQRWATGLEVEEDEEGNVKNAPISAVDRIMHASDPDARFGSFEVTDLRVYTGAIENRVQSMATRTRTPPHYMLGQSGTFPSGESLNSAETGVITKTRRRHRDANPGLRGAIRSGALIRGRRDLAERPIHVDWMNPESRSESEFVDSLVKKLSIGVPLVQIWEDYGYSPEQIRRFRGLLREQALNGGLLNTPGPDDQGVEDDPEPDPELATA